MMNSDDRSTRSAPPVLDYPSVDPNQHWRADTDPLLAPQSGWTHLAMAVLVLLLLWELRLPGQEPGLTLICMLCIILVTLYWTVRLALLLVLAALKCPRPRPHPLKDHWRRWLIIPTLFVFSAWSVLSGWPGRFVFARHRDAMRRVAEQALAGQAPATPLCIGPYHFDRIGLTSNGAAVSFYDRRGSWGFWITYTPGRTNGNLGGAWSAASHD